MGAPPPEGTEGDLAEGDFLGLRPTAKEAEGKVGWPHLSLTVPKDCDAAKAILAARTDISEGLNNSWRAEKRSLQDSFLILFSTWTAYH